MSNHLLFILLLVASLIFTSCTKKNVDPTKFLKITGNEFGIGLKGDTITITGEGFSTIPEENIVTFGTASAFVLSSSATEISVIVPDEAQLGQIHIGLSRKGYQPVSTLFFVSRYPVPKITNVQPASGAVGTLITIYGKNLSTSIGEVRLSFSDATGFALELAPEDSPAAPFSPLSFANADSIQVQVPRGAKTGPIWIWVYPNQSIDRGYNLPAVSPKFTVLP